LGNKTRGWWIKVVRVAGRAGGREGGSGVREGGREGGREGEREGGRVGGSEMRKTCARIEDRQTDR
jgi:hypothetical protein